MHILKRLEHHTRMTNNPTLAALLKKLKSYPNNEETQDPHDHDMFVPLKLTNPNNTKLNFLSTITTFNTTVDITTTELSIKSFFPTNKTTTTTLPTK